MTSPGDMMTRALQKMPRRHRRLVVAVVLFLPSMLPDLGFAQVAEHENVALPDVPVELPLASEQDAARKLSFCAVRDDERCIREVVEQGWSPDLINDAGETALFAAIASGAARAAEALVEAGADTSLALDGRSAEEFALLVGEPDIVRVVVADAEDRAAALLLAAAEAGQLEFLKEAISLGAEPATRGQGGITPLHLAVLGGSREVIAALKDAGAAPDDADNAGLTPLALAVGRQDVGMVRALLDAGASPDEPVQGLLPLSLAAMYGAEDIVTVLLDHGADPTLRNEDGTRPSLVAHLAGRTDISDLLGGTQDAARPSLLSALANGSSKDVLAALQNGAEIDERDQAGNTALMHAAAMGDVAQVKTLLSNEADLLAQNQKGETVLHVAMSVGDTMKRIRVGGELLRFAKLTDNLHRLLALRDETERSAATVFAARWGEGFNASDPFIESELAIMKGAMGSAVKATFSRADPDGVTPLAAAVVSRNGTAVRLLVEGGIMPQAIGASTLQELARSTEDWSTLFFLPDDRVLPDGLQAGASQETLAELQQRLMDWGYYPGPVDGVFGAGSRTALDAFLKDRQREILGMGQAFGVTNRKHGVTYRTYPADGTDRAHLIVELLDRGGCNWTVTRWNTTAETEASELAGCLRKGKSWPANGMAAYSKAGSASGVYLYGAEGWDSEVPLR